jgi:uncharacterized membrane protein YkoI
MKRLIALFLLLALVLVGCAEKSGPLTAEEAQKIALDHAGVKNAENVHTHVVSDREHPCYNIHLTIEGVSYEYLIDAITGEILSHGQGGH